MSTGNEPRLEPAVTKWWWLGVNAIFWSPEERLVRMALGGTTTVLFVLLSLPQWWLFTKLDLDPQIEVVGMFLTVAVAGLAARGRSASGYGLNSCGKAIRRPPSA